MPAPGPADLDSILAAAGPLLTELARIGAVIEPDHLEGSS
jgi:hypothetical protein